MLRLTPGFNLAYSMNGNRPNRNNWQIDGVDNNDFWHNAEAVNQGSISGIPGVLLPIEAIDQFNHQAAGGADFGRNPGSMVNVVMKSGTNDLHGSLYYFNRHEKLAAPNPFRSATAFQPPIRNHNFGFSLGGPVVRNKFFYFLTYERQDFMVGNQLLATVPSDAWVARARSVLDRYGYRVNPLMQRVLHTLWPSEIRGAPATSPNFFSNDKNEYDSDNAVANLSYNINDNHTLNIRAFLGTGDAVAFAGSVFRDYYQKVPSRQSNWAAIWNGVFTPRLVNQTLVGINYFLQTFNDENTGFNMPALGFNTEVTNPSNFGAPYMAISGFENAITGATPYLGRIDTTGHITNNLSYNAGSHAWKFGGEIRRSRLDVFYYREQRGAFTWTGTESNVPWGKDTSIPVAERALASFLVGAVDAERAGIATGDPQRVYDVDTFEWWVQDHWQAKPNLNVNFGVRWVYNGRIHEPGNRKGISIFRADLVNARTPGFGFLGKEIEALHPADWNNFAPRIGFAYTPKRGGSTVIRGAYGVYYDVINGNLYIDNRAGGSAGRGLPHNPAGAIARGPFAAYTIDQHIRSPYVQQYNLNVQRQLGRNTLLQIGYVGNLGRKLVVTRNINQPLLGVPGTVQQRRPYNARFPNLRGITSIETVGTSRYHGLQVSLRTVSWKGVQAQFQYTLGDVRDVMSSPRNNYFTDNYNMALDRGPADFDIRNSFTGYIVYDVPQLGRSLPRLTKGWQLNAFLAFNSGTPLTVYALGDISGTANFKDRADLIGDPFANVVQPARVNGRWVNGYRWYNAEAFANPKSGFGNTRRGQFRGPGYGSVDFSVFKTTPITERISAQFRVEVFNLFNRLNLAGPCASIGCGASNGLIFGTRNGAYAPGIGFGEPRNTQLVLKILW